MSCLAEKPIRITMQNGGKDGFGLVTYNENWFRIKVLCMQPGNLTCLAGDLDPQSTGNVNIVLVEAAMKNIDEGDNRGNNVSNGRIIVWDFNPNANRREMYITDYEGYVPRIQD